MNSLKSLAAPVFNLEQRKHAFAKIEKRLQSLKIQSYPIYSIEREHRFSEIQKDIASLKMLHGPVYDVGHVNKFNQAYSVEKCYSVSYLLFQVSL